MEQTYNADNKLTRLTKSHFRSIKTGKQYEKSLLKNLKTWKPAILK